MHAGIAAGVVDEQPILVGDGAIAEDHVGHVTHALFAHGGDEVASRGGDHFAGFLQIAQQGVDHVAQPRSGVAHAMHDVQPALGSLDGRGAGPVLYLLDGVVSFGIHQDLFIHFRRRHGIGEPPAYAATAAGIDEAVLGTGVEHVLAVHEFWMQHHIALLGTLGSQIRQALPVLEVLGAHDAGGGHGAGGIALGSIRILALGAEDAVDPSILVSREASVIEVGVRIGGLGREDGFWIEGPVVDAVLAARQGEEALAIPAFGADDQDVFAV